MSCLGYQPTYVNEWRAGIALASSQGDGYRIQLKWWQATPPTINFFVVYNIYYSSVREDVFTEGAKYVVVSPGDVQDNQYEVMLQGFKPGDTYYFAVRAASFQNNSVMLTQLPASYNGMREYPEGQLRFNITDDALQIPVTDIAQFPPMGLLQIGAELIGYSNRDLVDGYLVLSNPNQRGMYGTEPRIHTTDGYDGVRTYDNPLVRHFIGFEDGGLRTAVEVNKFTEQYARTNADGYKDRVDSFSSKDDLTTVEEVNEDFLRYDFGGYRRNHPADLLAGKCVGSYLGGEHYCADGYEGVGRQERGIPIQNLITQREEVLIETTGHRVALFRRMYAGKTSMHYDSIRENTAYRGFDNHGTAIVSGYERYWNTRDPAGLIRVSFNPTKEDIKRQEPGLENEFIPGCWTLVTPPVQDGDFFVRFNIDGTEEWRYEIIDVERNRTFNGEFGAQKFTAVRVRKTDPIYQVPLNRVSGTLPEELNTSMSTGPDGIPPHIHTIRVNENITDVTQLQTLTNVVQGHNHAVRQGVVIEVLEHSHSLII